MKTHLLQALHVVCRARGQQDEHAELALGVAHFQDLCRQLLYEADSEHAPLIHHLHSLLFILYKVTGWPDQLTDSHGPQLP